VGSYRDVVILSIAKDLRMRRVRFLAALGMTAMLATAAHAADVRIVKDPSRLQSIFPRDAKLRVVNVWATWCVPCVAEMGDLRTIDDAFGSEVAIVGVSLDNLLPDMTREKVASFLDRQRIAFPNVFYTGNADALGERLKFSGEIPVTIIYDRNGAELARRQGPIEAKETIALLRRLLRGKK
jgi:thiol-disulfide isomerase/thioredoxin